MGSIIRSRTSRSTALRTSLGAGPHPSREAALWAKSSPRKVRFHDLRHTTATLLLKEGVPLATVQRVLRHTDPRLTTEIYGHLDVEDMRAGLDRLRIPTPEAPQAAGHATVQDSSNDVPIFRPNGAPVVRGSAADAAPTTPAAARRSPLP